MPWVEEMGRALIWAPLFSPVFAAALLWRSAVWAQAGTVQRQVLIILGMLAANVFTVLLAFTAMAFLLLTTPLMPLPTQSLRSPEGTQVAHVVLDGVNKLLLDEGACNLQVFVQANHALFMRRVASRAEVSCHQPRPLLAWREGKVSLLSQKICPVHIRAIVSEDPPLAERQAVLGIGRQPDECN